MNEPETVEQPPAAPEPTSDYPGGRTAPPAEGGFRVALVGGSGPDAAREVRDLLRRRLRVAALLAVAAMTQYAGAWLLRPPGLLDAGVVATLTARPWIAPELVVDALAAVLFALLLSRRVFSLRLLRLMELLLFGTVYAYMSGEFWLMTVRMGWVPGIFDYGNLFASAAVITPFIIIVGYGVLIPNTWRRCLAVVGAMVLLTMAGWFVVLSRYSLPDALLWDYFTRLALFLGIAAALVVYGSHRIAVLRREAFEARKFGQYRLKRLLGAGGMGEVHLAEHVLLRRPCAIKLIRPGRPGAAKDLRRFEREVRATATLTHPNVVQIYDYGHAEDGTFYYVMEYLPGLTLEELVTRHGPLPPARAVHFLRQLCGALGEAHRIGLIHRDIKPTNVMVCERGGVRDVAKLLDFGLVLARGDGPEDEKLTQEGTITGTPAYMSPEQAGGQETPDPRSDVYSLGALAYFLLTGQPPFAGRAAVRILAAHLYEPPAPLTRHRPDLPSDLQDVVLRCLAKNPADRFADVESLEAALAGCEAAGQWSGKEAADWWRAHAGADGAGNAGQADEEPGPTACRD
jgi:eukaryotic-like serine/threonine-protein kinase